MLRMIEIGLVQSAALALVDGPGIAVPEAVELARLIIIADREFNHPRLAVLLAIEFHRHPDAVDLPNGAHHAIRETCIAGELAAGVAGELDAIANGERLGPVFGL